MRQLLACLLFVACAIPFGAASAQDAPKPALKVSAQAIAKARAEGTVRVLVMLRAPEAEASATKVRKREISLRADSVLAGISTGHVALRRRFALVPALALEVDAAALEELAADPAVVRVDIDAPGRGHAVAPDEASVLNQVAVLRDLGLDGSGQKVAVVDSGVDTDHADLVAQLVDQQCFCSGIDGAQGCCPNGEDTQSGLASALDDHGHGTNVSGIIVGAGGIAPRGAVPAAQLVAVKVLDAEGSFCCSSDVVAALDWLAVNHPDVDAVNLSLGTFALFPGNCDNAASFTQALAVAVDTLTSLGAVVTASTGNQGNASMSSAPACVADAVGVGATWDFDGGPLTFLGCSENSTAAKQPTCFSNHSTTTDLYAAGAFVTSTGSNGGTSTYGGTSQAAPMVAACAAALKQAAPQSTVADRIDAMRVAPTSIEHDGQSYPFLDCLDAVSLFAGTEGQRSDIDGDGLSDVVWRHGGRGANVLWRSANHATAAALAGVRDTGWVIAAIGDFAGDGRSDLVWQHPNRRDVLVWEDGDHARARVAGQNLYLYSGSMVEAVLDVDDDGRDDLLFRRGDGWVYVWPEGDDARWQEPGWDVLPNPLFSEEVHTVATGDFDGDGRDDFVRRNMRTGTNELYPDADYTRRRSIGTVRDQGWQVVAAGDFDGDGEDDLFWRHATTGVNTIWPSADPSRARAAARVPRTEWQVVAAGDYDGDGTDDLFWRNAATGGTLLWPSAEAALVMRRAGVADLDWQVVDDRH